MRIPAIVALALTAGFAIGGEVEADKGAEILRQAAPVIEEVARFDDEMQRFEQPTHGGRWVAIVRSRLPDGRTVMRSLTLFSRTEELFWRFPIR